MELSCKKCPTPQDQLSASTASRQATKPTCAKKTQPSSNAGENTYPRPSQIHPISHPSKNVYDVETVTKYKTELQKNKRRSTDTPAPFEKKKSNNL
ncbi:hypothetical protein O181_072602 [Austropuccinia psidii MF-1]|uniref:Uncharacterized protein n=1 Tax=Austropuccinia psidii MF-1 TaxID=1389203 RepID=A0A9Q3IAA3_9BASI|nr:hypothetical protein [Austropuccinia psidii MF-1]